MMGALTFFIKLLPYIWPFLREMVLGRKTFLEAVRDNKKKAFFVALVIFSFGLNFVLVPRSSTLAMEYLALERKYKELEAQNKPLGSSSKQTVSQGKEVRLPTPKSTVVEEVPAEAVNEHIEVAKVIVKRKLKPKVTFPKPLPPTPKIIPDTHLNKIKAHYEEMRLREEKTNP